MMISKWPKMNLTFLLHLLAISMPTENLFSVFTMITSNMPNNCRRWLEVVQHDKDELWALEYVVNGLDGLWFFCLTSHLTWHLPVLFSAYLIMHK